jgi:hypothetical protein
MRELLLVLIIVHGLLHVLGFVKAFKLARLDQMPHPISRVNGVFWLLAACLVLTTGILFYFFVSGWWMVGIASVIVSEYVIITDWEDAGLGSTLNILILLISIIGLILAQ